MLTVKITFQKVIYHKQEQSKLTNNPLCILKLNESARFIPSSKCLYSGQIRAEPAYAASICNQIFVPFTKNYKTS